MNLQLISMKLLLVLHVFISSCHVVNGYLMPKPQHSSSDDVVAFLPSSLSSPPPQQQQQQQQSPVDGSNSSINSLDDERLQVAYNEWRQRYCMMMDDGDCGGRHIEESRKEIFAYHFYQVETYKIKTGLCKG